MCFHREGTHFSTPKSYFLPDNWIIFLMAGQYWKTLDLVLICCTTLCMKQASLWAWAAPPPSLPAEEPHLAAGRRNQAASHCIAGCDNCRAEKEAWLDRTRYSTLAGQYIRCRSSSVSKVSLCLWLNPCDYHISLIPCQFSLCTT